MGTYINLSILPSRVSNLEWEQIYDESLKLLNAFPFADIEEREIFGYKLQVYVKATEKKGPLQHWTVRGDINSKRYAESFRLYRDIIKYQSFRKEKMQKNDILFVEDREKIVDVFESKTQGYEYHLFVLAIAMLVESRLENVALVGGDIDYDQCIKAKQWADKFLSIPIELPVRVHFDKLLYRISRANNELEKIQFIEKWLIADQEEMFLVIFKYFPQESFLDWFLNKLRSYSSANQLGALKLLIYYLNLTNDLNNLLFFCCKHEKGPRFPSSEIIRAIAHTWICLPPEKFAYLEVFAKVSGHPQIMERQLGTIILDLQFAGREIKKFISPSKVAKILSEYLPDSTTINIETSLKQEIDKIEEQLIVFYNQIRYAIELSDKSFEDRKYLADEDAFLYYDGSTIVLTEEQEFILKALAFSIKTVLHQEKKGDFQQYLFGPSDNLKLILAAFVDEKYKMIITEQAWQWIAESDDPFLIRILLVKLIIDDATGLQNVKSQSDLRKAMFENQLLTKTIKDYMKDEAAMLQFEK
ncbi:hypothetical protein HPT25_07645 [Bacillus sp. BRMEA1]|uniref:hypothetical protein n=1 Tax=Neobacillus endophyticus TaxID=2738405 RepID=UPI0015648058|nr:hypothetical protein [Neobacillus endophyticus]NRD77372.1 hypothetical protein [Neobacillus endophyticus]